MGFNLGKTLGSSSGVQNFLVNPIGSINSTLFGKNADPLGGLYSKAFGITDGKNNSGYDASGRPIIPEFQSTLGGTAYKELQGQVANKGLNPWNAMALSRQNKMAQGNIEEALS